MPSKKCPQCPRLVPWFTGYGPVKNYCTSKCWRKGMAESTRKHIEEENADGTNGSSSTAN